MVKVIASIFFASSLLIMHNEDKFKTVAKSSEDEKIEIIDTVKFEGLFVFDRIHSDMFLIKKSMMKKVKFQYKSVNEFQNKFRRVSKENFVESFWIKKYLEKYTDYSCNQDARIPIIPYTHGISVFNSEKGQIYFSLFSLNVLKIRIETGLINELPGYERLKNESKSEKSVIVYTTFFCDDL